MGNRYKISNDFPMIDLPKSKYSDPLHTPGKEFTLNGKEYVGWYVITYQDRYFTGKSITRDSKEIFEIVSPSVSDLTEKVFVEQVVSPSIEERVSGIWKRYILQKKNSQVIIEVTKERYLAFDKDPGYRKTTIDWVIKGPAQNIRKGSYTYTGAENKNKETVSKLEFYFPGIQNYFKNYSQFVE